MHPRIAFDYMLGWNHEERTGYGVFSAAVMSS